MKLETQVKIYKKSAEKWMKSEIKTRMNLTGETIHIHVRLRNDGKPSNK